jgi:hypothetical protein
MFPELSRQTLQKGYGTGESPTTASGKSYAVLFRIINVSRASEKVSKFKNTVKKISGNPCNRFRSFQYFFCSVSTGKC